MQGNPADWRPVRRRPVPPRAPLAALLSTLEVPLLATLLASACTAAVTLLIVGVIVWAILAAVLRATGMVLARGIVLSVAPQPSSTGGVGQGRYQMRTVRIDVEIDGQRPFEITTLAQIPARFVEDVLPGATIAIRVNPKATSQIQVVGPGMAVPAFALTQQPRKGS